MVELSKKSDLYTVEETRGFRKVIVDKNGKRVFGEFPYYTQFSFYGPAVIGRYMDGDGKITFYVSGKSEKGWEQTITCSNYELLENGNILVRFNGGRPDFIFDPKQGQRVSENVDTIGRFINRDKETGTPYAYAVINVPRELHSKVTLFSLYGKMDLSGKFISDLYNKETGEVWKIHEEGFSFPQKTEETRKQMIEKEERTFKEIENLPVLSKRK